MGCPAAATIGSQRRNARNEIVSSINQKPPRSLPDFCNLGVNLRVLVGVAVMSLGAAAVKGSSYGATWQELLDISAVVQPVLLASLLLLCLGRRVLRRLSYGWSLLAVAGVVVGVTTAAHFFARQLGGDVGPLPRYWLLALFPTVALLAYFDLHSRALSPALSEARLQALQARIRPHFLFNAINAVLSVIRSDPKRAEHALMDLAELFRVLMADNRRLIPLAAEVDLCRQYLGLEQLRLGDRLRVVWHTDKMPAQALVPPLVLQPLLENAVYHGIEPSAEPGEITIDLYRSGHEVHLVLRNPYPPDGSHHAGNKMALANIRERLALHFDAEASLQTLAREGFYQVHIILPYMTEAT
jgi:two-component system sensor histidine kinase AlgZ